MDALKNEIELSEQIKKLAEHLTFIEKKLDQLLEARDRQPSHNADPRPSSFQQRPGGFRPNGPGGFRPSGSGFRPNTGYRPNNAGGPRPTSGTYRPNSGPSGSFRPSRPGGQDGARPYSPNRGEGRPSGDRPNNGPSGNKPFHAKYSSKNQNRNSR